MRLTIAQVIDALKVPGTYYSGSDWKFGYPHKFYLCHVDKFYTEELEKATPEELDAFSNLSERFFGVKFYRDEKGALLYRCEYVDLTGCGYQRAGHVGPNGDPERIDTWNPDHPKYAVN